MRTSMNTSVAAPQPPRKSNLTRSHSLNGSARIREIAPMEKTMNDVCGAIFGFVSFP